MDDEYKVKEWIERVVVQHRKRAENVNIVFCSNKVIQKVNNQYLKHDYPTDVITFDNSEGNMSNIEGDIYVGVEMVQENAKEYKSAFQQELYRVIIHGILHLLGFNDKSDTDKKVMRRMEDECLGLIA